MSASSRAREHAAGPRVLITVKRIGAAELLLKLPSGQMLRMDPETAGGLAQALATVSSGTCDEAIVRAATRPIDV